MKVLAIIPARGGSKGVPNKNIKILGDRPLIAYSIESALATNLIQDVVVSTDSKEIKQISLQYGAQVPFMRPDYLSNDSAKSIDVVIHTLEYFKKKRVTYDAVILLQPTTPFRKTTLIEKALKKYKGDYLDSLVSVLPVPTKYNPHWVFEENEEGRLFISTGEVEIIPRRQDLPKVYIRDGSIYITSTEVILNDKTFYGKALGFLEVSHQLHVNIDTLEDWAKAENILKSNFEGVAKLIP
jgi:CMP-N,N'-diacetyllegionaminic acid synthase